MLSPSQQQWLREQTEPSKRSQAEMVSMACASPPSAGTTPTPSSTPGVDDCLVMWRARGILARVRSNDSSPESDKASSVSAESSRDEGSDIGRIRDVVINPRRA